MTRINTDTGAFDIPERHIIEGSLVGDEIHVQPEPTTGTAAEKPLTDDQVNGVIGCLAVGTFSAAVFGGGMLILGNTIGESHPRLGAAVKVVGGVALVGAGITGWAAKKLAVNADRLTRSA